MAQKVVFPGDVLATSEELVPGPGTTDDGSNILATRFGKLHVDTERMEAAVEPVTSVPVELREGDIVLGVIDMVKPVMCSVDVQVRIGDENRQITGSTVGTIHVSKIDRRYVHDASQEYRVGDIVRGRVIDTDPSVQLATDEPEMGAIKALCTRCRHDLERKGKALECPNCGKVESRKIARDYGQGKLI